MVSETWLKCKLDKWFTHQCSYYSYSRLKSARLSQVCKSFSLQRRDSFDSKTSSPLITKDEGCNRVKIVRSKTFTAGDGAKVKKNKEESINNKYKCNSKENQPHGNTERNEGRWTSLRLSFNRKTEKTRGDRNKPVLPEVLKTYDKGLNRSNMNTNSLNSSKVPASSIPKFDVFDFQIHQRQFMNELQIKRDQVAQLKKEIDAANLKIHELSRSLETAKNVNEEQQHNLNLALKNVRFHEDKLQTKRDSMARTHIQQESIIQERESLRGVLQSVELQNYSLMREFNELKAQYNCDVTSQKDLLNQDVKVRAKIAELTEAIQKFKIDQKEIMELKSKVEEQESLQKNVSFYMDKYYECKNNYVILEVKYIKVNAALQKYEELLSGKIPENISPEIQIVLDQWEKATEWFHQQSEIQKTIIENLSYALKVEKEGNIKICKYEAGLEIEKEELLKEIEELKTKLNYYLKEYKDCETQTEVDINEVKMIKNEIIEITDEN